MTAHQHDFATAAAARSQALVADVELGLASTDPDDRAWWRAKAQSRVDALNEVGEWLGRFDFEDAELDRLNQLLAAPHARQQGGGEL